MSAKHEAPSFGDNVDTPPQLAHGHATGHHGHTEEPEYKRRRIRPGFYIGADERPLEYDSDAYNGIGGIGDQDIPYVG